MRKYLIPWFNSKVLFLWLGLVSLSFQACNLAESDEEQGNVIASVKDSYLYKKDLQKIFNQPVDKEDSLQMRKQFIDNWVKEQLFYYKALENLPDHKTNKDEKLQSYYESLVRYEYEQALLEQRLDERVAKKDVKNYYDAHKKDFKLHKPIVRLIYLKIPNDAPRLHKIRKWYRSDDVAALDSLYKYGVHYATNFLLEDEDWHYLGNILSKLPIDPQDQVNFIRNNRYVNVSDSTHNYYIKFKEYKTSGEPAPIGMKINKIRNIILNKRKAEFIKNIKQKIFEKEIASNEVSINE